MYVNRPKASGKTIVVPVELRVALFEQELPLTVQFSSPTIGVTVTDHRVPLGSPVPVNVAL